MAIPRPDRILILSAESGARTDCRQLFAETGYDTTVKAVGELNAENLRQCHLTVVDAGRNGAAGLHAVRRCRAYLGDHLTPLLFVADAELAQAREAGLQAGADACLIRPFLPHELLAQSRALLRWKHEQDRLREKTTEMAGIHRRLQATFTRLDAEMELARCVQRSFLPANLPQLGNVRIAVSYHPCSHVSGDFYDVFRVDENHLGFYVADVMGHGLPASLLTVYLKQAVRGKEISADGYRLLSPAEVLGRLNRDLIALNLADSRFITMVYGLLDVRDGRLRFSRAGHPHPLLVPASGEPRWLSSDGSLLGVFETDFRGQRHSLSPGDKLILYTDGADGSDNTVTAGQRLHALAIKLRSSPIARFIEEMTHELRPHGSAADDLTILGLEISRPGDDWPQPIIRS